MKVPIILTIFLLSLVITSGIEINHNTILEKFIDRPTKELFKVFHLLFNKTYLLNTLEGINRYRTFVKNLNYINQENSKKLSYQLGINQFTDVSDEEFQLKFIATPEKFQNDIKEMNKRFLSYFDDHADEEETNSSPTITNLVKIVKDRTNIDHSEWYLPPRNQGTCGSCWIFSALSVLEANYAMRNKEWTKQYFSAQMMLDCLPYKAPCLGGRSC